MRRRWVPGVTTAAHVDPAVKALFAAANLRGMNMRMISEACGISVATISSWARGEFTPKTCHFRAALNAVGLDLLVVPKR